MKIASLSTCDIQGGAARAAYRIHQCLQDAGLDTVMIVQKKLSSDETVAEERLLSNRIKYKLRRISLRVRTGKTQSFFTSGLGNAVDISQHLRQFAPDIIHLHWVAGGMMSIDSIAQLLELRIPIVWTLHDMWAFTGGCHYDDECGRYTQQCGDCPQLGRRHSEDMSTRVFNHKRSAWETLELNIVTPSAWLAECADNSSLLKNQNISLIPYGLDLNIFKPGGAQQTRRQFQLPLDRKLILFGAIAATSDRRKGFDLLLEAIHALNQINKDADLVVFGADRPAHPPDFGRQVHYLGEIHDDLQLARLYSAVDVMVAPSRQDNLPNTVLESLACGTPVAAFDIGGMGDMIKHKRNGWLAPPFGTKDLAAGINWILEDDVRHADMSVSARQDAEKTWSLKQCASQYLELYKRLLSE